MNEMTEKIRDMVAEIEQALKPLTSRQRKFVEILATGESATSLITEVQAAGGHIDACDGKLRLSAPAPLPEELISQIRAHKPELLVALCQKETSDHAEAITEYMDERAAIQEYDGGLTREQAEAEARRALRVYEYRLVDNPDSWLILIAPGCDIDETRKDLQARFGSRFLDIRKHNHAD